MPTESAEDMERRYIAVMGKTIGDTFYDLMQQNALLHLKWNEYVALFGKTERQIEDMNKAAPGFFWLVQEIWWEDIILHIFRMIDRRRDVHSVHRLQDLLKAAKITVSGLKSRLATLVDTADFARQIRNEMLAHRKVADHHHAEPIPPVSRDSIREALAAMDDLLHCVDHHFTQTLPTFYDHLDTHGGSQTLVWHVRRGVAARDDDIEHHRPFMSFPD